MDIPRDKEVPLGRIALVTGSAKGLGRETAIRLADDMSGVAVHFNKSKEAAEDVAGLIGRKGKKSAVFAGDLTDEKQAASLVREVEKTFGRIDVLINNVGPFLVKPWQDLTGGDLDTMFRGVFGSALFCLKAALPGMRERKWGRVINIGYSRAEQLASFPTITAYAAAKTGLLILTRTAAVSEVAAGITVNMVSPGLIEGGALPPIKSIPREAVGKPGDVAAAVAYLASDEAASITGANIIVAGTWKM